MIRSFLIFLSLFGCARKNDMQDTVGNTDALATRYQKYRELAPRAWDASSGCDALLFAALQQVGLNEESPALQDAMESPGHWFRRQDASSCGSDISRDMFMGLFVYIWHFQKLSWAEDIWSYGELHGWVMGAEREGPNTRTVLTPGMITLLADIIHGLGGKDHPERLLQIPAYSSAPGYESHLTLLHLLLNGSIHGSLTDIELDYLVLIRKHMALNPLVHALIHRYSDGDQSEAISLLLEIWPAKRLPTHQDWQEEWRLQRSDGNSGLYPNPGGTFQSHSGGDLLLPALLILGEFP